MIVLLVLCGLAAAEPWFDGPAAIDARADGADRLLGVGGAAANWRMADPTPIFSLSSVPWTFAPLARVSVGDLVPVNHNGDVEPGGVALTLTPTTRVDWGPTVVRFSPSIQAYAADEVGGAGVGANLRVEELWVGGQWRHTEIGFGKAPRWVGPGRRGTLLWSDNAVPPWMGSVGADGRLPKKLNFLGHFRGEFALGWLDQPRTDVDRPGLLFIDLRYAPIPQLEIGATRMSVFGGVGRPPVNVGQLLLPTEPHVYDDPDLLVADQDEIASVDARLTLPLRRWVGGPVRYVEGWWEYGGEDVIGRQYGAITVPALAGVGNLGGVEVCVDRLVVTVEYLRLMDDYFRWYVGHRVYHEGFTQNGRPLGDFAGTDAQRVYGALAWEQGGWRARVWAEQLRRVTVLEVRGENVFTLATEEHHSRGGVDVAANVANSGRWMLGYALDRVTGESFVPGANATHHSFMLTWSPPPWTGTLGKPVEAPIRGPPPLPVKSPVDLPVPGPPPLPVVPPPLLPAPVVPAPPPLPA